MICKKCGMSGIISRSCLRVEGDNAAETVTRVFRVLTFRCRNKQCSEFGKEIGQQEIEEKITN